MRSTTSLSLKEFNWLVLEHQDKAFTLAGYMLGNSEQASQIVQAAFIQAFEEFRGPATKFCQRVLGLVASACLHRQVTPPSLEQPINRQTQEASYRLLTLPAEQRLALILVDLLGLSYTEAAAVVPCSDRRIRQLLTAGRRKF
jgi:RNA polymerase sigma-70 factor (ECF subfamily)